MFAFIIIIDEHRAVVQLLLLYLAMYPVLGPVQVWTEWQDIGLGEQIRRVKKISWIHLVNIYFGQQEILHSQMALF